MIWQFFKTVDHILQAQTIHKIGDVFLKMSDYHEAMESYNWALEVMFEEPDHHHIDIGEILDNKGTIHYSKGEVDEALQYHQEALRSKQEDLGEDHPELSATYHHIGNCLSDQGNIEDAVIHFEEAIRLKELDPDGGPERDADVLTMEGILNNLERNQKQGLECYERSLQILVTKVPYRKEKIASLLHLIGCVFLMSGELKKAMKLFEESLNARRKVLGFVHLDVASTLFNMAFLHQHRGRTSKALRCLEGKRSKCYNSENLLMISFRSAFNIMDHSLSHLRCAPFANKKQIFFANRGLKDSTVALAG